VEFLFGEHHLDVDRRELRRGVDLVAVEPQVFDLLVYLLRNRDRVLSKDDLIASVWRGRIVSESTITSHIHAARKAIGDSGDTQALIRTLPRKGIRFIGEVREGDARPAAELSDKTPTSVCSDVAAPAYPPNNARPHLSIVVLPFTNLSDDREQQYFTDGITDDLTTDLTRLASMFVISRNTAFTYRNRPVDAKEIGRQLGVRYVLEGSVRRSGSQVRLNAQLIDAETNAHLWAERFDRDMSDLFTLQNEIVSCLANALNIELITAEAARPTERPDALDYILRGRALGFKQHSQESFAERIRLFERALALDPQSVEAQTRLAAVLVGRVTAGTTDSPAADIARAEELIGQALAASPRYAHAHNIKGRVLSAQNRWEEAIPEYETALALNRNSAAALQGLGQCKLLAGPIEEVIPLEEQAIRLSPRDPFIGYMYFVIGTAHLLQSRIDEASVWLEKARSAMPPVPIVRSGLASAYALRGETERAAAEIAEARRLNGGDLFSSLASVKAGWGWGMPKTHALFEATYFAGLRKAGMQDG
jgi:TolB-like protein/Flp pilus assembly protein TadD